MTGIRKALVAFLSFRDVLSEHLVKFIEICYELSCPSGSDVTIRVNRDGRVVALVGVEGGDTSGSIQSVVIRKFRKRE